MVECSTAAVLQYWDFPVAANAALMQSGLAFIDTAEVRAFSALHCALCSEQQRQQRQQLVLLSGLTFIDTAEVRAGAAEQQFWQLVRQQTKNTRSAALQHMSMVLAGVRCADAVRAHLHRQCRGARSCSTAAVLPEVSQEEFMSLWCGEL
jgi:hypothetical protein